LLYIFLFVLLLLFKNNYLGGKFKIPRSKKCWTPGTHPQAVV